MVHITWDNNQGSTMLLFQIVTGQKEPVVIILSLIHIYCLIQFLIGVADPKDEVISHNTYYKKPCPYGGFILLNATI